VAYNLPRVGLAFGRLQDLDKGLQEGLQSRQHAAQQTGPDFRIVEQFAQPDLKASFHRSAPSSEFRSLEGGCTSKTYGRSRRRIE
jgi:hypothetical protein